MKYFSIALHGTLILIGIIYLFYARNSLPNWLPQIAICSLFIYAALYLRRKIANPSWLSFALWITAAFFLGVELYYSELNMFPILGFILGISLFMSGINYLQRPYLWKYIWLFRRNRPLDAAAYLDKWIKGHPEHAHALLMRAALYLSLGKPVEAEQDARKALEFKPNWDVGHGQLGRSLMSQGRYEEARESFQIAQRIKPHFRHLTRIAFASYRLGDYRSAADLFAQVTTRHIDTSDHYLLEHYLLGKSLEQLGETEKAAKAFEKMKRLKVDLTSLIEKENSMPDYPEVLALRADLVNMQQILNS